MWNLHFYLLLFIVWSRTTTADYMDCEIEISARTAKCTEMFTKNMQPVDTGDLYQGSESTKKVCSTADELVRCFNKPISEKCKDHKKGTLDDLIISKAKRTKKELNCPNKTSSFSMGKSVSQSALMLTSSTLILNFLLVLQTTFS